MRTENLNNALVAVSKFSSRRTPKDEYSKTYLISCDGKLSVMAMGGDGACVVHTDEEWETTAVVACDKLMPILRNYGSEEVQLQRREEQLVISDSTSTVELPVYTVAIPAAPVAQGGVVISKDEWMHAADCMAFTGIDTEVDFAQGQRLLAKDGELYFLSASKGGMSGTSVDADGTMDVIVPSSALSAATTAISRVGGDTVSLQVSGGTVLISSGQMVARVVQVAGKPPHGRDVFDRVAKSAVQWNVPHAELLGFLAKARVFLAKEHTGIDLEATPKGLVLTFSAINDEGIISIESGGTCRAIIPGNFPSGRVCIKHAAIYEMVKIAGADMKFCVRDQMGVFVTSGRYFAGYAHMTRVSQCK